MLSTAKDILISEMVLSEGMSHDVLDEKIEDAIKDSYKLSENQNNDGNGTVSL